MFYILFFYFISFFFFPSLKSLDNNIDKILKNRFYDLMTIFNDKDNSYLYKGISYYGLSNRDILSFYSNLYNKNIDYYFSTHKYYKIPRKIHQIWLGSPLPDKYKLLIENIKKLHPKWEYKLWTDDDIENLRLYNASVYNNTSNYGEKSDIARYEILYRFGGVYLDVDIQCNFNLDKLNRAFHFYAGFEPLWAQGSGLATIGNAIIASTPGHPILKRCIEKISNIPKNYNYYSVMAIVTRTGPLMFTKSINEIHNFPYVNGYNYIDIIFPSNLFYPWPNNSRKIVKFNSKRSFFIHYWSHSWVEKKVKSNK